MSKGKIEIKCKNVFKSETEVQRREQYTKKWGILINRIERNKQ